MSEQPESKTGVAVSRNRPGADIQVEDVVRLRKPHPCGSFDWRV